MNLLISTVIFLNRKQPRQSYGPKGQKGARGDYGDRDELLITGRQPVVRKGKRFQPALFNISEF